MRRQYGIVFSAIIHAFILLIPISVVVQKHVQDIELFVEFDDVQMQRDVFMKIVKPVIAKNREPETVRENIEPAEVSVPVVKHIDVTELKEEIEVPPVRVPAQHNSPQALQQVALAPSPEMIDTEFGAAAAPLFLHRAMPVYPLFARKLGKEGTVLLRLAIDERGNLLQVEVVEKAGFGFVEAAVDAVKKSTFLPAKKDGKPVASRALLPVRFVLRRDS